MYRFEEIGQNGHFGAKMAILGSKRGRKVKFEIFRGKKNFVIFFKTKKLVYMAKISNIQCTDLDK